MSRIAKRPLPTTPLLDMLAALVPMPKRAPKAATIDNPLRRIGRAMETLAESNVRRVKLAKVDARGDGINPVRREKSIIRRELGLTSGRAWRRWRKAAERADRLNRSVP